MDIVVTGIGLISCLGNLHQTWEKILQGESGIKLYQPFRELNPYPLGLIKNQPINLTELTQSIVADALIDAQLTVPLSHCGVVIGSSRGCQGIWEKLAQSNQELELSHWLETLPHQAAIIAARQIKTTYMVQSPMAACGTGLWAIFQGVELIRQGKCQQVIAGAVESPITPLTLAGFKKMGVLAQTGCYPFDRHREGLVLGEGGAVLVLESAKVACRRGAFIYGKILDFGFTCDANHISTPAIDNQMASRAIKKCLERSNLEPTDIDYIQPHGTSTLFNDHREASLIQSLFPSDIPVSSTKGSTGHTLGASGAIAVAITLMALRYQELPPCVGLKNPEFELNFLIESYKAQIKKILCLGFGFGGQNAAITLSF
ncbi:MAG TPA: beta-ketoacyl-ACP synthase [Cyanothece sp. UBA12306]|nr:beta-ketoacyl-ACP synthase [Cyanothece sp. UBA12306]